MKYNILAAYNAEVGGGIVGVLAADWPEASRTASTPEQRAILDADAVRSQLTPEFKTAIDSGAYHPAFKVQVFDNPADAEALAKEMNSGKHGITWQHWRWVEVEVPDVA